MISLHSPQEGTVVALSGNHHISFGNALEEQDTSSVTLPRCAGLPVKAARVWPRTRKGRHGDGDKGRCNCGDMGVYPAARRHTLVLL